MASVLPFNVIEVDGVEVVGPKAFKYGTGTLDFNGTDSANTTADGRIHNYRSAEAYSSTFEATGDLRSIDTGHGTKWPHVSGLISLKFQTGSAEAATVLKEFNGIISVEYDTSDNKSTCTITGDSTAY